MKPRSQDVMGHRLPGPRFTLTAIWLVFLWIGIPILAIGGLLDLAVQLVTGTCTGLWCLVN